MRIPAVACIDRLCINCRCGWSIALQEHDDGGPTTESELPREADPDDYDLTS